MFQGQSLGCGSGICGNGRVPLESLGGVQLYSRQSSMPHTNVSSI